MAMTDTPETAAAPAPDPAITALSFEAAMGELETIVRRLESGDVSLEESVALYERGHALRGHCEARLAAAHHSGGDVGGCFRAGDICVMI